MDADLWRDALRSLHAHVTVLDAEGKVLAVHGGAPGRASPSPRALPDASPGEDYPARCEAVSSAAGDAADKMARGIRDVLAGRRPSFHLEVPGESGDESRWAALRVEPLAGNAGGVVVSRADMTGRGHAVEALRGTRDELVRRLGGRTTELARANRGLRAELGERERTERELRLLQSLILAVAEATDVRAAMMTVLERLCGPTGWDHGEAWLPGGGGAFLECAAIWQTPRPGLTAFEAATAGLTFARGEGLPGRVWESRRAEWIDDVTKTGYFVRAQAAQRVGLKTGVAVPIVSGEEVVAVMAFLMSTRREKNDRLVHLLSAGASALGSAIARKRADDRLRALNQELERRVAERTAELRERESRLRAIVDTAAEGIVTSDDRGIIEHVNPAAARMFGHAAEDLAGRHVQIMMSEPRGLPADQSIAACLRAGASDIVGVSRELAGRRRDGSAFPLELTLSEFHAGGRRHFTAVMRDMSERKRAEERLRRHQDELAQAGRLSTIAEMASSIAHELNQPLAAVVAYSEACTRALEGGDHDAAQLGDTLRRISEQSLRAADMIRRLRNLVRKQDAAKAPLSVNSLVEDVLALTAKEARELDVEVEVRLDERLPRVYADAIQIEQVLLQLVRNALEAMRSVERRSLALATRSTEGGVEVIVSDTGAGLTPESRERVFDPFYTTRSGGIGMGLPISRTIAEAHHGRLWLESHTGRGTDVHLMLPSPGRSVAA